MSKKYLLYIHHERFAREENKSALVNGLLADHYGLNESNNNTTSIASITEIELGLPATVPESEQAVDHAKLKAERLRRITTDNSLCDHGRKKDDCVFRGCEFNLNTR